eukprot:44436-Prorocentrum_lima.AAC.1
MPATLPKPNGEGEVQLMRCLCALWRRALGKVIRKDNGTVATKKRGKLIWFEKSHQAPIPPL